MVQIDNAIKELKSFNKVHGISMDEVSWWLLKYEDLFECCSHNITPGELPSSEQLFSTKSKFRSIYEDLANLEKLKSMESIFQQRFVLYKLIKNDPRKFKEWIEHNKEEALESHFDLWFEWTDHDPEKIKPFILYWQHLNISIPYFEFKYTLKVLEIFHNHYWE